MKRLVHSLALVVLTSYGAGIANAAVIFDSGVTAVGGGQSSDPENGISAAASFTLAPGANTIADLHWTGFYISAFIPITSDFRLRFFADAGGVPEVSPPLHTVFGTPTRTDTGVDVSMNDFDLFAYTLDISPLTLPANTTFWLEIAEVTSGTFWSWGIENVETSPPAVAVRGAEDEPWTPNPFIGRADFQLTGPSEAVPEPSTIGLLGAGLGLLGFLRRRR